MTDFNRIEKKIDRLDERLDRIDVTLGAQHVSLKEHIRRTNALESQLEPVKKHVAMVHGAIKLIGLMGILGGIVEAIVSFSK